ncbi:MAG: GNAT family N-acetyltransferase [Coriobacteriia bacterium]|nr:GNAT family N-acetyltransferase [Coriobacteriia bacterium]MCL2605937.1 GNAT family N-acetyltransferase [Coriobacteriia bacterium]
MINVEKLNPRDDITLELIPVAGVDAEIPALVHQVLYFDWDVPFEPIDYWYESQLGGRFLIARKALNAQDGLDVNVMPEDTLLGVCRLMPIEPGTPAQIQVRQVVVTAASQGLGIGTLLMKMCEEVARAEGIGEIYLWSRSPAYRFYENLDYVYTSDTWISHLTGLEHKTMTKYL